MPLEPDRDSWAIVYDDEKRLSNLQKHGLDFADAGKVLLSTLGDTFTALDLRQGYGEDRFITIGRLGERCVVIVHTETDSLFRVISMRYAERHEEEAYYRALTGR